MRGGLEVGEIITKLGLKNIREGPEARESLTRRMKREDESLIRKEEALLNMDACLVNNQEGNANANVKEMKSVGVQEQTVHVCMNTNDKTALKNMVSMHTYESSSKIDTMGTNSTNNKFKFKHDDIDVSWAWSWNKNESKCD